MHNITGYLYNTGRYVHIKIGNIHLRYLGPKSLVEFIKINLYDDGYIEVDTKFNRGGKIEIEEDYIDVTDILQDFGYNTKEVLSRVNNFIIIKGKEAIK